MKLLTSFLQDFVIVFALWLALKWTNLSFEWYHWAIIIVGMVLYGYKQHREGLAFGKAHAAFMTPADFDIWLKSHNLSPADYTKVKE